MKNAETSSDMEEIGEVILRMEFIQIGKMRVETLNSKPGNLVRSMKGKKN